MLAILLGLSLCGNILQDNGFEKIEVRNIYTMSRELPRHSPIQVYISKSADQKLSAIRGLELNLDLGMVLGIVADYPVGPRGERDFFNRLSDNEFAFVFVSETDPLIRKMAWEEILSTPIEAFAATDPKRGNLFESGKNQPRRAIVIRVEKLTAGIKNLEAFRARLVSALAGVIYGDVQLASNHEPESPNKDVWERYNSGTLHRYETARAAFEDLYNRSGKWEIDLGRRDQSAWRSYFRKTQKRRELAASEKLSKCSELLMKASRLDQSWAKHGGFTEK